MATSLLTPPPLPLSLGDEVLAGLTRTGQKTLPSKLFYDQVGSVLFEAICALPEYGLTKADARLLQANAAAMVTPFARGVAVAELGSGSGEKTRWILETLCRRQPTDYYPIEISSIALKQCQAELASIEDLTIYPQEADYLAGLGALAARRGPAPLLVLFLGSTFGNFDPGPGHEFLLSVRRLLRPGDGLLLGLDLIKPVKLLKLAYDDPAGVTAAFNRNALARLNREFDADFDLRYWRHKIRYTRRPARVEMHLVSQRHQTAHLRVLDCAISFVRGESIWTESSHKFRPRAVASMVAGAGFRLHQQWRDEAWPFAENLCLAIE
ncbi:MAG TPA: L-histidine N(alpha)-methyltransferase [Terriglobales bacterium]|nr:L-histidine N(alpha)-methyltransferase [Terriglobales bacterium]